MPGSNPYEAVENFLHPFERAISCLGRAKIVVSPGGQAQMGKVHAWTLNREAGMSVGGFHLEAQMHYEIIRDDRDGYGPFRVTTKAYRYRISHGPLNLQGAPDLVRMHWHPTGVSHETRPHLHLALNMPDATGAIQDTMDGHMPGPRFTFEQAVEWAIELGWPAAREDWAEVLADCQRDHIRFRSWSEMPVPDRT